MFRICILIPYFGKWPFWMPFFLESCRRNPDIDWKFFSDCDRLENVPPNVHIAAMSFGDYCDFISRQLDIRFVPTKPYKLCDIRSAFGHIHAADLQGYDFWGFGDVDVVYGQLRAWFTPERLARYDLLSSHTRRVSGHLTLIRNTPQMCQLFRRIPNWQERFCGPHQSMDEKAFSRIFIKRKNFPRPLFKFANWFNPWWRKSDFREAYSTPNGKIPWVDGSYDFPCHWYWREGHLTNDKDGDREFPYLHFITYKKKWEKNPVQLDEDYSRIVRSGAWQVSAEGFSAFA
ncbi:MAG: hypothetical protein LBV44_00495 [Methylobacillus sp.]|nr:hypothetical protein [Methylobacillus sp.]